MGSLRSDLSARCAGGRRYRQKLTSQHRCWLGITEKWPFALSRPGIEPAVAAFTQSPAKAMRYGPIALQYPFTSSLLKGEPSGRSITWSISRNGILYTFPLDFWPVAKVAKRLSWVPLCCTHRFASLTSWTWPKLKGVAKALTASRTTLFLLLNWKERINMAALWGAQIRCFFCINIDRTNRWGLQRNYIHTHARTHAHTFLHFQANMRLQFAFHLRLTKRQNIPNWMCCSSFVEHQCW